MQNIYIIWCQNVNIYSAVIWIKFNQRQAQFHHHSKMGLGSKVLTIFAIG